MNGIAILWSSRSPWVAARPHVIRPPEHPMAVAALKQKPLLKTFHATVHVTRVEQWCVEAETAEDARELLAAGAGYRCEIGDCVNVEVERVED
jgi:hypothetical protein